MAQADRKDGTDITARQSEIVDALAKRPKPDSEEEFHALINDVVDETGSSRSYVKEVRDRFGDLIIQRRSISDGDDGAESNESDDGGGGTPESEDENEKPMSFSFKPEPQTDDDDGFDLPASVEGEWYELLPHHATEDDVKWETPYYGKVNNTEHYGVFVTLAKRGYEETNGLVHESALPPNTSPENFQRGDEVVVALKERKNDGKIQLRMVGEINTIPIVGFERRDLPEAPPGAKALEQLQEGEESAQYDDLDEPEEERKPARYQCPFCSFADGSEDVVRLHVTHSTDGKHKNRNGHFDSVNVIVLDEIGDEIERVGPDKPFRPPESITGDVLPDSCDPESRAAEIMEAAIRKPGWGAMKIAEEVYDGDSSKNPYVYKVLGKYLRVDDEPDTEPEDGETKVTDNGVELNQDGPPFECVCGDEFDSSSARNGHLTHCEEYKQAKIDEVAPNKPFSKLTRKQQSVILARLDDPDPDRTTASIERQADVSTGYGYTILDRYDDLIEHTKRRIDAGETSLQELRDQSGLDMKLSSDVEDDTEDESEPEPSPDDDPGPEPIEASETEDVGAVTPDDQPAPGPDSTATEDDEYPINVGFTADMAFEIVGDRRYDEEIRRRVFDSVRES